MSVKLCISACRLAQTRLMGSDSLESLGMKLNQGNDVYIFIAPDSKDEADRIFAALSAGGEIENADG